MRELDRLLAAAREGQPWAGYALASQLLPPLLDYARRVAPDLGPADCEEAVERAILRSVDNLERYDPSRASFPTWVRGLVRLMLADRRRALQQLTDQVSSLPDAEEQRAGEEPSISPLTWNLLKLDEADQLLIKLHIFENLSFRDCAELIEGVTEGACRTRFHRAMKKLRHDMTAEPKSPAEPSTDE